MKPGEELLKVVNDAMELVRSGIPGAIIAYCKLLLCDPEVQKLARDKNINELHLQVAAAVWLTIAKQLEDGGEDWVQKLVIELGRECDVPPSTNDIIIMLNSITQHPDLMDTVTTAITAVNTAHPIPTEDLTSDGVFYLPAVPAADASSAEGNIQYTTSFNGSTPSQPAHDPLTRLSMVSLTLGGLSPDAPLDTLG